MPIVLGLASACGESEGHRRLHQVVDAPEQIAAYRGAVVRIRHGQASGTGFFTGPDPKLVTNAHVLGPGSCALKGCWVNLELYLAADVIPESHTVFVVPVAVDIAHDLAVWKPIRTLDFEGLPHVSTSLLAPEPELGDALHVMGHPYAGLKKWSSGVLLDADERWLSSDALVAPGNSGSPVFDDEGRFVGVVSRAGLMPTRDSWSATMLVVPAKHLVPLLEDGAEYTALPDLDKVITVDGVLALERNRYNARRATMNLEVSGTIREVPVVEALADICDAEMEKPDPLLESEALRIYNSCVVGVRWLNCDPSKEDHQTCPQTEEREAWSGRVTGAGTKIAALLPDTISATANAASRLTHSLHDRSFTQYPAKLDVSAPYTAADAVQAIAWHGLKAERPPEWAITAVTDFKKTPGYGRDATGILVGLLLLGDTPAALTENAVKGRAKRLLRDDALTMRSYLRLEHDIYRLQWQGLLE